MKFFASLCRDHAWLVVLACIAVTVPVAAGMGFIQVKAGQKDLIPTKYEASRTIKDVDRLFGGINTEVPMVESEYLLSYPMIKKFLLLEDKMADEVGEEYYVSVEHFLSGFARNMMNEARKQYGPMVKDISTIIRFGEGTMVPDPSDPGKTLPFEEVLEKGVQQYLANPVARRWTVEKEGSALLSRDNRYAAIWIKVNPDLNTEESREAARRFEDFFHSYFEDGEVPATVTVTGDPSIDRDLESYVMQSTWLLALIAVLVLMALLYLTFQRLTDIFLPLLVIVVSAVWIYGLMGWLHIPYTMVSAVLGPLVLGISLGNLVYMMSRFYEEFGIRRDQREAAYRAVVTVGVAIFLACITTFFGFASFGFSDFDALQQFGFMGAAGIAVCFVLSVTLLPALMVLRENRRLRRGSSRVPRGVAIFAAGGTSRYDRLMERISGISQDRPRAVVAIYVLLVLACVLGTFRLTTTPDLRALAPQDISSLQAQYRQERVFGGMQQDVLLITGDVLDPQVLLAMRRFQEEVASTPYFTPNGSSSIAELIQDFRTEMGKVEPGAESAAALPATPEEAEEDLASIARLFGPQEGNLISADHRAALISIFSEGARDNREMMEKDRVLREAAEKCFGALDVGYRLGGITPMTVAMLGNLVPTQIRTAILALLLSGLVLVVIFRSLTYGLATLTVLIAGVAAELGFLALMGWTLDMMTVLVASMIIGMGIDYGIHVTHRFLEEYSPHEVSVAEALDISVVRVGKPLLASVVSTGGAFLIISLSKMAPIRRFGLITAVSLAVSLAASLLVLPSVITLITRGKPQPRAEWEEEAEPEAVTPA
ncbi:MMPL family transporter [Candidatus Solincola tengchongensis]|uniref:efflux RND transporter permease subunit n=1 Tax=Candidatus Solincola tengchongensis TaxID=2900693 RepID=UPI00257CF06E|nr:MMPL family transporter [Candidatus Solincola tengchongensis]